MTLALGLLNLFVLIFIAVQLAKLAHLADTKIEIAVTPPLEEPNAKASVEPSLDKLLEETPPSKLEIRPSAYYNPDYELMHEDGTPTGHYVTVGSLHYKQAIERGYNLRRVE
jgi:hypothetical protein